MEDKAFNAVLYCNRAAAYHAMSKYIDAIADCFTASALDASYVRVLQRRADAYVAIGDHTNAAQVTMLTVLLCTTRPWHSALHLTGVAGDDLGSLPCMLPIEQMGACLCIIILLLHSKPCHRARRIVAGSSALVPKGRGQRER